MFPIILTNFEIEVRGARMLLEALDQIAPAQRALQRLNQKASISQIADWFQTELLTAFREEQQRSETLERKLALEQHQVAILRSILDKYYADPVEQRIEDMRLARDYAEQRLAKTEQSLKRLEQQSEFEIARHKKQVSAYEERVAELERVVAQQRRKLKKLTGSDTYNEM